MSTVSTSYGPIIVSAERSVRSYGMILGLGLAFLSALLFTANNFLFQFWRMNETDMLLTRGVLQAASLSIAVISSSCFSTFLPKSCSGSSIVLSQGMIGVNIENFIIFMTIRNFEWFESGNDIREYEISSHRRRLDNQINRTYLDIILGKGSSFFK